MAYPETSPILDFTIVDTHNLLTLAIADTSFYPDNFTVVSPTYEITPPNYMKVAVVFEKGEMLILNSNSLNITCVGSVDLLVDLPDGVWLVKQSIAPAIDHSKEQSFIRTAKLEQKLGKAFLKTDMIECGQAIKEQHMKVIDEAMFYLQGSISAANACNYKLAMRLYGVANKILDNFIKAGKSWC